MVQDTETQQAEPVGQHAMQTRSALGQKPSTARTVLGKGTVSPSGLRRPLCWPKGSG